MKAVVLSPIVFGGKAVFPGETIEMTREQFNSVGAYVAPAEDEPKPAAKPVVEKKVIEKKVVTEVKAPVKAVKPAAAKKTAKKAIRKK